MVIKLEKDDYKKLNVKGRITMSRFRIKMLKKPKENYLISNILIHI